MLIPSIDLQGGRVVQLEQGERLRVADADLDRWVARFRDFPLVQVIDLDAATGRGSNAAIVGDLCRRLPCQVGGGLRDPERARAAMDAGARRVIIGSALFDASGARPDRARAFADALGRDAVVAAVDARGGRVVVHGWRTVTPVTPAEAVAALAPHAGAFLYTHVDGEGLMRGLDLDAVRAVRAATTRPLIAAGGIRDLAEVEALDRDGIDAVVGMAIYTGRLDPRPPGNTSARPPV
ncbi:MAG: HisA/HisF-related TIM barrel protein [Vicinamibacterales bacterium]